MSRQGMNVKPRLFTDKLFFIIITTQISKEFILGGRREDAVATRLASGLDQFRNRLK
jgi:hypothetical protein